MGGKNRPMIPPPPEPKAIAAGLVYGFRLATATAVAGNPKAHPQTVTAAWQALWVYWLMALISGVFVIGVETSLLALLRLVVISVVSTLLFPVVSYSVIAWLGRVARYPAFIIAVTWLNIFSQLVLLTLLHLLAPVAAENATPRHILAAVAIWLLWATWRAAAQSLAAGAWVGLLMVLVMLAVGLAMLLGQLAIAYHHIGI